MSEITQNGFNWRDFNPWKMYYLFHQPLHFFIAGHLYNFSFWLFSSTIIAKESLQYISLFYTSASIIILSFILRLFKFSDKIYRTLLVLLATNPIFFLLSGYASDDGAILFWSLFCLYFLMIWYRTIKIKFIIYSAICFVLGTLSKLSILMLVPAISCLFLYKLKFEKKYRSDVFFQILVFAIITMSFSLLWVIRNHLLFDMPFYHVPDTSPQGQNFTNLTFFARFFDYSMIFKPFLDAPYIVDNNMWFTLLKTELFGEWDFSKFHGFLYYFASTLFLINVVLHIIVLKTGLLILYKSLIQLDKNMVLYTFLSIIYFTIFIYSLKYSMEYPYICSSDYRLFSQLLLPHIVFIGLVLKNSALKALFTYIIYAYAFLSIFIYTCLVI